MHPHQCQFKLTPRPVTSINTWSRDTYVDRLPMYSYFTQGTPITKVELDVLTGEHSVLRSDIEMSVGRSISPAIDHCPIEDTLVQV
ncbi:hypothetical protein HOY80DRAFT_966197 [Tuber brumale]|nr:hypothetical protein HOY80DRAFT_966197 [Tuber brumale]